MTDILGKDYWRSTLSGQEVARIRRELEEKRDPGGSTPDVTKAVALIRPPSLEDGDLLAFLVQRGAELFVPFNEVMDAVEEHTTYQVYEPHYKVAKTEYDTELARNGWGLAFQASPAQSHAQWYGALTAGEIHWARTRIKLGEPHQEPALQKAPVSPVQLTEDLGAESGLPARDLVPILNESLSSFEPWSQLQERLADAGGGIEKDSPLRDDYNAVLLLAHNQITGRKPLSRSWHQEASSQFIFSRNNGEVYREPHSQPTNATAQEGRRRHDETTPSRSYDEDLAAESRAGRDVHHDETEPRATQAEGKPVVGQYTAASEPKDERRSPVAFEKLLVRIQACGFDPRLAEGLRGCVEREWEFERVEAELASKGRPLTYPGDEIAARSLLVQSYNEACRSMGASVQR